MQFVIRPYRESDLEGCAQSLHESFIHCPMEERDWRVLRNYTQFLLQISHYAYVAEVEGEVAGLLCATYSKKALPALAKGRPVKPRGATMLQLMVQMAGGRWTKSEPFWAAFRTFFDVGMDRGTPIIKGLLAGADSELLALASREAYRKGVGTALVNAMVARCRQDGGHSIRLITNTDCTYRFYDKYGFRCVHRSPYQTKKHVGESMVYELTV